MLALLSMLALMTQDAAAEPPAAFEVQGFRSQIVVEIGAPVAEVFDAATGDISGWWDHSFSGNPAELVIEPRFGGRFYERVVAGEAGGALHATVIYVDPPTRLRLDGPLGLSGRAVHLVSSWTLSEAQGGTLFTVDLSLAGEVDADLAAAVTNVWDHFIRERLKAYVEAGCHLVPETPCAAFAG